MCPEYFEKIAVISIIRGRRTATLLKVVFTGKTIHFPDFSIRRNILN